MASSRITGTNENISTYGDGTRNYTSLATWESATDNDLVTATTSEVLECYADAASFTDTITFSGATTNTSYFRILRAASGQEHNGIPATGVHFVNTTDATVVAINEANVSVQDISIFNDVNSINSRYCVLIQANNARIIGVLSKTLNAGAGSGHGFLVNTGTSIFVNCLAYECKTNGFWGFDVTTQYFYNCTAIGNSRGYRAESNAVVICKNCLSSGNTTGFSTATSGVFTGSDFNASADTTAPGTTVYISQTFTFVGAASDDYHLHRNDLGAKFRGTNLSADATFAFDDDIDGDTITNWSIGFHAEETQQSSRRTGDNENVSTYAASGADYTSLSVWESATDNDLVTGAVTEVLECAAGVYDDTVSLTDATTDRRYFRIIRPRAIDRHNGVIGSGVIFNYTSAAVLTVFTINESNVSVQDVSITGAHNSASMFTGFTFGAAGHSSSAAGLLVYSMANAGVGAGVGINFASSLNTAYAINCLVLNCKSSGFSANSSAANVYLFNCTTIGNTNGVFRGSSATVTATNCLASDNSTAGFSGTITQSFNASSDATASGTGSRTSQTFTFVNAGTDNYHLSASDAGAKSFGTSMVTNTSFNFNDDIDGTTVTAWSIGFDSDPNHAGGKAGEIRLTSKVHGVLT